MVGILPRSMIEYLVVRQLRKRHDGCSEGISLKPDASLFAKARIHFIDLRQGLLLIPRATGLGLNPKLIEWRALGLPRLETIWRNGRWDR